MNKAKAVVLGVMMFAAITASATDEITTVIGEVGKDVKLSLESNLTTGYDWTIKDLPSGLTLVSGGYKQSKDRPKGAAGRGGEGVLHPISEKKGESTLKLTYDQSFSKSS